MLNYYSPYLASCVAGFSEVDGMFDSRPAKLPSNTNQSNSLKLAQHSKKEKQTAEKGLGIHQFAR